RAYDTLTQRRVEYDRSLHKEPSRTPIDAELLGKEAEALLLAGEAARARVKLEEAVAAAPDQPHYHALYGWASFLEAFSDDPRKAKEAAGRAWAELEQALSLDPDDPDAHEYAGRIAAAAGDDERAIQHLERALDAQPTRAQALESLEAAYTRKSAWKLL